MDIIHSSIETLLWLLVTHLNNQTKEWKVYLLNITAKICQTGTLGFPKSYYALSSIKLCLYLENVILIRV